MSLTVSLTADDSADVKGLTAALEAIAADTSFSVTAATLTDAAGNSVDLLPTPAPTPLDDLHAARDALDGALSTLKSATPSDVTLTADQVAAILDAARAVDDATDELDAAPGVQLPRLAGASHPAELDAETGPTPEEQAHIDQALAGTGPVAL